MMVCPYCQAQNVDDAAFCTRCGQAVGRAAGLAGVPMGEGEQKGLAITALVAGILSLLGCVGVGSLVAIICGVMAISRVNKEPAVHGGKGMAIAGIVTGSLSMVAAIFIGIIAAIAIPSLLRARWAANESMAIGDIRTVISSQMAYASANSGSYDNPSCLEQPSSCIPGYEGPVFLDRELASARPKGGYNRTFHLGPQAAEVTEAMSPTSVTAFAYVAVPMNPGRTGRRAFCGDSTGSICFTPDGAEPEVVDGLCQAGPRCTALR